MTPEQARQRLELERDTLPQELAQAAAQESVRRLHLRQRRVDAALARLSARTWGRCCACESIMDSDRLQADPTALFCTPCQEDRDEEQRAQAAQTLRQGRPG